MERLAALPFTVPIRRLITHRPERVGAALVFTAAAALYGLTVAPSVVFWDSGEFIASAFGLQVMHPPGAPLYILLGRLFAMISGAEHAALAVNLVSVLAAAFTALLAFLIIVRLVRRARGGPLPFSGLAGAVIGSLALVVSDTFWFNAVEAEVYALATLLVAVIVWLALKWRDEIDGAHSYRLPAGAGRRPDGRNRIPTSRNRIPTSRDRIHAGPPRIHAAWTGHRYLILIALLFGLSIGIHLMSILTYFFIVPLAFFALVDRSSWPPAERAAKFVAAFIIGGLAFTAIYPGMVITLPEMAGRIGSPIIALILLAVLLAGGLHLTRTHRKPLAHLAFLCAAVALVGYSSFSVIPIRSAADPEIDLNDPETADALISYLKREQYGQTPLVKGATYDDRTGGIDFEQSALFPRRHSSDPNHLALYAQYTSDFQYFTRYQLGHMYGRYFMWNFVGRAHDVQHARWISGFESVKDLPYHYQTPSERESRNAYFALPLLLGLIGLILHFRSDWRTALSLSILFVVMGVGLVVYLNEVPVTPRERDYIFVGSFFVFCMWIGVGAAFLIEHVASLVRQRGRRFVAVAAALVLAAAVPGWMGVQNYADHDRSGNLAARDYAYNLLMSVEEDAILFTGGDNDTYPLWYLQAVENVRRDVRVVCLPLLQTGWYALQLKNQDAFDAAPVPMSMTDEHLDELRPVAWQPREIVLPVDDERLLSRPALRTAVEDTNGFESPMRWRVEGRRYTDELRYLMPSEQVILDILATNARRGWVRPIYFATSSPASERLNLEPYLQQEGLALRVVPIRHDRPNGRVVPSIMTSRLYRFRFTNLDDPDVYFADDARSIVGFNYRLAFSQAADTLVEENEPEEAEHVLATLMDEVPTDTIPLHPYQAVTLGRTFLSLGARSDVTSMAATAEPRLLRDIQFADDRSELQTHLRIAQALRMLLIDAEAIDAASAFSGRLADVLKE